jgi:hypothetical protein
VITPEQIEALLESGAADPTLILTAGTVMVVPTSALDSERYRGAVEIISRHDLGALLGTDVPSRRDLKETAARLDTAVTQLGA